MISQNRFDPRRLLLPPALKTALLPLIEPDFSVTQFVLIIGETGSGKTHILHAFKDALTAQLWQAKDVPEPPKWDAPVLMIDDADYCDQTVLFHLYNQAKASQQALILTTSVPLKDWHFTVPDLQSRLMSMRAVILPELEPSYQLALLEKLLNDRAINASKDFIDYLLRRCDRSIEKMQALVDDLIIFANGRPFNRSLARDYLETSHSLPFD